MTTGESMKKMGNNIIIASVIITLWIVCFILTVSIIDLFFPDLFSFEEPYEYDYESRYYDFDLTQNETDFSFLITVVSESDHKLQTNTSNLDLSLLVPNQTESLSVLDYQTTKDFIKHHEYYSYDCERTPAEINFSIIFLISITYFDNDEDKYISKGDYFIIEIKDLDKNESFNLSQYTYEKVVFRLSNDYRRGYLTLNKQPSELQQSPEESSVDASSTITAHRIIHFILIFSSIIFIGFLLYYLSKLIKNKKDNT